MLKFSRYLNREPLEEAGFSTKTSNLNKYIPMINKDFRMGFEVECYVDESNLESESEPEYYEDTYEDFIDTDSFQKFMDDIPALGQKFTPSISDALYTMFTGPDREELFGREACLQAINILGVEDEDNLDDVIPSMFKKIMQSQDFRENVDAGDNFWNEFASEVQGELESRGLTWNGQEVDSVDVAYNKSTGRIMFTLTYQNIDEYSETNRGSSPIEYTREFLGEKGFKGFEVVEDGSLDDETGAEIVSPVFENVPTALKAYQKLIKVLKADGYTVNDDTGLHVSFSFKDRSKEKQIDWLKYFVLSGSQYVQTMFDRMDNEYASNFKDIIERTIQASTDADEDYTNYKIFANRFYLKIGGDFGKSVSISDTSRMGRNANPYDYTDVKYNAITLKDMAKTHGRIEIRLMGGEKMFDTNLVVKSVYRLLAPLYAAMDDNYLRKEYLTKVHKLISRKHPDKALPNTVEIVKTKINPLAASISQTILVNKNSIGDILNNLAYQASSDFRRSELPANEKYWKLMFDRISPEAYTAMKQAMESVKMKPEIVFNRMDGIINRWSAYTNNPLESAVEHRLSLYFMAKLMGLPKTS